MSADPYALSFGGAAEAYERGRPAWPAELLGELPLAAGAEVLDLAAGTGKLTRLLVERYRVTAVEPDAAMREVLARVVPAAAVLAGSAESIPLADDAVDAIFVAEAFHWFDGGRALAEFARVLRPRGVVALLWNRYDREAHVLPAGVLPASGTPKHTLLASGEWRAPFEAAPFEPLREAAVPREQEASREELLDYFASISPVAVLAPEERRAALARIAAALDRPSYPRRWTAQLYWTRLAA